MRQIERRRIICGICAAALWLGGAAARAADATMFDEGRAQHAFAAIQDRVGHDLRVLTLRITRDELSIGIPNADKPGEVETWSVSHAGLAGALGVDLPVLEGSARASLPGGGAIAESVIDIDAAGLAIVPRLVADALARARFQQPGHATEMELMRLPKFLGPGARDPYWQMHVEAPEEDADISAKLTGEIKNADLNRTRRAANLDLLAGGPDFDEMVQNIRQEIKDDWIYHYIEIDKTAINFDVHLLSVKNPRITRFTANLSSIRTNNLNMPHMTFPGAPADDPFSLADVDLSLMARIEATARERLAIADGIVQRVILSKPHRERGGTVEWEVQVRSAGAPLFTMPNSPPAAEGSVTFDAKGNVLHAKYPPGYGPQTNLFDPAALQKAIDKIAERLGPHVLLSELLIDGKTIKITAQDPQDSKKFAAFTYQDEDVARAPVMFQTMANALGGGPDWLWDAALLKPAVVQSLAALEKQTMAQLGIAHGAIERITISKDKTFHPGNDKVLMEIRASGDGQDSQWETFDLGGAVAKLDAPASGVYVGAPGGQRAASQDKEDCSRSHDPEKAIPACARVAENVGETAQNRAISYFDRAIAYRDRKEYDRAVADYSEALKLDPQYADAYLNRGWILASRGEAQNAIADFDQAMRFKPSSSLPYFNRGLVYHGQKNYAAAISDFDRALVLDANYGPGYRYRGLAYAGGGAYEKALADYGEALKRDSRDALTLAARADAYRALNKFDLAIADYDLAIKLDANNADAYRSRGWISRLKGEHDRAIADYNEAIKRNPKFAAAYYDRGLSYRAKGDFDHAVADANQAMQFAPKWASPYCLRGFSYYLSGALPKALADMTQANALDPSAAYSVLMLEIIGQRSKLPSRLGELSARLDMTAWPAPVVRLYLRQLNPEAVLAAADDPNPLTRQGRICEANFYPGELALLAGRGEDAAPLFTRAFSDCPLEFDERQLAGAELKTMGIVRPPAKP